MKFIHLSDLHLGKRVNEFSMLEDQAYILLKIIDIIDEEHPAAVIIAGDVYDKSVPSAEAVQLFDDFLYALAKRRLQVFVISGNHDSPERIAFGSRLMKPGGIHFSPVYNGKPSPVTMQESGLTVDVYLLPFVKPANVRRFFPEEEIESYTDALRVAVKQLELNPENVNLLVTHQFVTGAARSESEEISVGGADNVDASVFAPFDYVALGHIHGPQNVGGEAAGSIRYCGTPLKYSFSEARQEKSVTVVNFLPKARQEAGANIAQQNIHELECSNDCLLQLYTVPLTPKRDLREIKGTYMELTAKSFYEGTSREDYLHITLTDEEDIPDAIGKLRTIYPNLMKLDYDNKRTRSNAQLSDIREMEQKTPLELFSEFYEQQNNQPMTEEQREFTEKLIETINGGLTCAR